MLVGAGGGRVQRRPQVVVARVHVAAVLDEQAEERDAVVDAALMDGGEAVLVGRVHAHARVEQALDLVVVLAHDRVQYDDVVVELEARRARLLEQVMMMMIWRILMLLIALLVLLLLLLRSCGGRFELLARLLLLLRN